MKKPFLPCLLFLWMGGCTAPVPKSADVPDSRPAVTLADGSRCLRPADYEQLRDTENASRLRVLFLGNGRAEDWMPSLREWKVGYGEADAMFFENCKAWEEKSLAGPDLDRSRMIYLAIRQQLLDDGIRRWLSAGSIEDAGKLCLVIFGSNTDNPKNFTRLVPGDTSVDDCALMAHKLGASRVLLGCTDGRWKNRWSAEPIEAGPLGTKDRRLDLKRKNRIPEINCAWNSV